MLATAAVLASVAVAPVLATALAAALAVVPARESVVEQVVGSHLKWVQACLLGRALALALVWSLKSQSGSV